MSRTLRAGSSPMIPQPGRSIRSCSARYSAASWLNRPPANHNARLGSLNNPTTPARSSCSDRDASVASRARVNASRLCRDDVVVADGPPGDVEGRQSLGAGLHLLAQRPLEVGIAVEADLPDEPEHGRPGHAGALGELRQALEPRGRDRSRAASRATRRSDGVSCPSRSRTSSPIVSLARVIGRFLFEAHSLRISLPTGGMVTDLTSSRERCRMLPIGPGGRGDDPQNGRALVHARAARRRLQHDQLQQRRGSGGSASGSPTGTPIVIGFPADLTTDWAYYDKPMEQGAQFAVDKINDAGGLLGRPLQLKTVDMRDDVAEGAKVTQQLIDDGAVVPDRHGRRRDPGRGPGRLHRRGSRSPPASAPRRPWSEAWATARSSS